MSVRTILEPPAVPARPADAARPGLLGRAVLRGRARPWPQRLVETMRARALGDLYFFCQAVLGFTLFEDEPHGALCRWLSRPARYGKRLVLMPRGAFKSSLVTVGYTLWRIAQNPNIRVLIDSDLRANAKKFAGQIRMTIEANDRFRQLFGDLKQEGGWTEDAFTVRREAILKEPTVMTSGVDQVVVGLHFDLAIADDVVNDKTIHTAEALERTAEHIRLLGPLMELPQINPQVETILVGTRWHDADAYAGVLRASGWRDDELTEALAAGEAEVGEWDVFFRADRRADGTPLFSLFTDDFLARQLRDLGPALYAANYRNDPTPGDSALIRREWFRYWSPPLPDDLVVVMAVDPAISEQRHGDYSAIVVLGATPGKALYVLEAWRARVNPRELIDQILALYIEYHPHIVGMEEVAFQRAMRLMLDDEMARRGVMLPIRPLRPDTRETKEMRIRAIQPYFERGQLYHRREHVALETELLRFPKGRHDDLIDALAYGCQLFAPTVTTERRATYQPENLTTGY